MVSTVKVHGATAALPAASRASTWNSIAVGAVTVGSGSVAGELQVAYAGGVGPER